MIKKKEIRVCDFCKKEVVNPFLKCECNLYEGGAAICWGKRDIEFDDWDFCGFECFMKYLKNKLKVDQ